MPNYHLSPQATARFRAMARDVRDDAEDLDSLARRHQGKVLIPYYQGYDATLDRIFLRGNACQALVTEWLRLCGEGTTDLEISSWLYDVANDEARTNRLGRFMRAQRLVMANEQHRWLQARDMANQPFGDEMARADLRASFASLRADPRHATLRTAQILTPAAFDGRTEDAKNEVQWTYGKFARLRQLEYSVLQASYAAGTTLIRNFDTVAAAGRAAAISQFIKSAASEWGAGTAVTIHMLGGGTAGHALGLHYKTDLVSFFDPNRGVFCWKGYDKQTKLLGFKNCFTRIANRLDYNNYSLIILNRYSPV